MKTKTLFLNYLRTVFKIPLLEKWLRKRTIGTTSNDFSFKLAPNNYQYKEGAIRNFVYKGIMLKADIRDYVGHYLYFGFKDGAHEKLMQLVKPDFTILDIGTNIGSTLLQFASKTGINGKVYGFEPDPINYTACLENIKLNSFDNIEVANIGLGDKKGEFYLVVDTEANRGGNRIQLKQDNIKQKTTINVEVLDFWLNDKNINSIDLIKVDVEGFEKKVLKGAEQTLKKYNPILFIEIDENNLDQVGDTPKELIEYLEHMNYSITNANNNQKVSSHHDFDNCHFDIIAHKHN